MSVLRPNWDSVYDVSVITVFLSNGYVAPYFLPEYLKKRNPLLCIGNDLVFIL